MAWNGRCEEIGNSSPGCMQNAFPSIARRAWRWRRRASRWRPFASRSKVHCNLEEIRKTRGRAWPGLIAQVSEEENHSEVVLPAVGFHDGTGLVHGGVGLLGQRHSHAKGEGKGEGTRGEERRLRFLRRVPEWPSCRNRDVLDLSDQQRQRYPLRVQDRECSHCGRAKFRYAAHRERGSPALRVEGVKPGARGIGGASE